MTGAAALARPAQTYDGEGAAALARRLAVPDVALFDTIGSTQDVAHALAARGAPSHTLVLADAQTAGRGRFGRSWRSEAGKGIWLTMIERPTDRLAVDVLSIRVGLAAATALDGCADLPIRLKWPNDLYRGAGKVGGILLEARWRAGCLDWAAIGFGLNLVQPDAVPGGTDLGSRISRLELLERIVSAIRGAALATGHLDASEQRAFAARDWAVGRRARTPVAGVIAGIDASGALLVDTANGRLAVRSGSLTVEEDT